MKNQDSICRIPNQELQLSLPEGKKIYFLSDTHLGTPVFQNHREREQHLVRWLASIQPDCGILCLLGDIFDFWFEYKRVVPKGFIRFLGKICELTDQGIPVHFFTGNHDIWIVDYLPRECGVILHTHNEIFHINNQKLLVGHGDALNPRDKRYTCIYKTFHNRFLQACFRRLHPDFGIYLAEKWSSHSRLENGKIEADPFRGEEQEEIVQFCKSTLKNQHFDYFVFGHRHHPIDFPLAANSRYINTGDWLTWFTYAVFDGTTMQLHSFPPA